MPIFRFVAVCGGFIRHDGHLTHFRILFFDEILAGLAFDFAAEKQLQTTVQRVPQHRILRAEQFG